jgi:hypothetical protein
VVSLPRLPTTPKNSLAIGGQNIQRRLVVEHERTSMPRELLPKVEVSEFSEPTKQVLEDMLRKVLAEKVSEPIMVGASKAGGVLGFGRTQFYNLRVKYPSLEGLAVKLGDGHKLYWLVDDLKAWAREMRDAQARPGGASGASSDEVYSADSLDEAA